MTVSVIIPTLNRAGPLARALESVLAQTQPPDEIIVIDDGSTDETRTLIEHDYPGVRYHYQSNHGVSNARNTGIGMARGDWIALLDSDDQWQPRKLQHQLHALASRPDYRACHTNEIWIRNGRRVNPMNKHAKRGGFIFRHCLPRCVISPSSVLIHRELFSSIGTFDESLPACEDYDLWLRLCARHPVLYLDEPLVIKHGGHADQLSRHHWGMDRFRILALEKLLGHTDLAPADRHASTQMLLEKAAIVLQGAQRRGNRPLAREYRQKIEYYSGARTAGHRPPPLASGQPFREST
jgi:glycosyltransferase involved in cell wall biosynthesis